MRLIDDSPALFLGICFVVVYAVVGVEAAMLMAPSVAFMALAFLLIATVAGAICAWMFRLLDDGAPVVALPAEVERVVPAAAEERIQPQPGRRLILN
jgi:hypothetical protein